MPWLGIVGHDEVVERFRRALGRGRLASSFLFVGPEGIGKRRFAMAVAQTLLCQTRPEHLMDPCQTCPACLQVAALTHPDLDYVRKPDDKAFLPLELLIGDRDNRGREGLNHRIGLKPFMGGRKVAILDDADYLNPEGANCLLKTLEEPPPRSVLILLGTSAAKQLPTIRSRCQVIRFQPLAPALVAEVLLAQRLVPQPDEALRLARLSGGSIQWALKLADTQLQGWRERIHQSLPDPRLDSVALAYEIVRWLEQAGPEAAARRELLRTLLAFAAECYDRVLRWLVGVADSCSDQLSACPAKAVEVWSGRAEIAVRCAQQCLEAIEQVDRNVHPTTVVEAWLDGIARTYALAGLGRDGGRTGPA